MTRNGYQHMVLDQYVAQVRQIRKARAARLEAIATPKDTLAYQQYVREIIGRAFAPRPPKTPLNAQVTGELELPAYRIEKVVFESRPGCVVTANLYIPHGLDAPAPCVLGTCGHSEAGTPSFTASTLGTRTSTSSTGRTSAWSRRSTVSRSTCGTWTR